MAQQRAALFAATPEVLADFISSATRRLIVLAPALSLAIASAVEERWRTLGAERVTITLDVDPEVYRLGYGDPAALELLESVGRELGGILNRHPGIRIGLVIADDAVVAYSPVPELIEAGPRDPNATNAISLGSAPPGLEDALGVGKSGHQAQTVGLDKATTADITEVKANLVADPPQKFDVTRRVRVFNAAFQFVELTMTGTSIGRRSVQIPTDLLGVADDATSEQLRTMLRIVPTGSEISGEKLEGFRHRIERDHLKTIPKFGQALLRKNKNVFERDVVLLKESVEAFKNEVREKLASELATRVVELEKALLPRLREAPPKAWMLPLEEPERGRIIGQRLRQDLTHAIGSAEKLIRHMEVKVIFKDVTYESLADDAFIAAALKAFPGLPQLHAEFDTAAASSPAAG